MWKHAPCYPQLSRSAFVVLPQPVVCRGWSYRAWPPGGWLNSGGHQVWQEATLQHRQLSASQFKRAVGMVKLTTQEGRDDPSVGYLG